MSLLLNPNNAVSVGSNFQSALFNVRLDREEFMEKNKTIQPSSSAPAPELKHIITSVGPLSDLALDLPAASHTTSSVQTLTLLVPLFLAPLRFWQSLWVSMLIFRVKWGWIFHIQALNRCHTPGMVISLLN